MLIIGAIIFICFCIVAGTHFKSKHMLVDPTVHHNAHPLKTPRSGSYFKPLENAWRIQEFEVGSGVGQELLVAQKDLRNLEGRDVVNQAPFCTTRFSVPVLPEQSAGTLPSTPAPFGIF